MKNIHIRWICLIFIGLSISCSDDSTSGQVIPSSNGSTPTGNSSDWLIPQDEVFDGGPGKDGIPAIDAPQFIAVDQVDYLDDDNLVIGFKDGDVIRAYPHAILDWHEIVNDDINGIKLSVVYCPLTGTATGWDRILNGEETTFGVSGLLYNTNIIPYDRETDSNWSQMELQCVQGPLKGLRPTMHLLVETSWAHWKETFPNSEVLSLNTGWNRPYDVYPYGDYRTSNRVNFPIANRDERLPLKERTLGVITDDVVKAYSINSFESEVSIIRDNVGGEDAVIVGSKGRNFILAFEPEVDELVLNFTAVQDEGEIIMESEDGTKWNIFGEAVSGPLATGNAESTAKLRPMDAFMGFWFSWGAFYPEVQLYQ